ncbi:ATP-dependent nuclease [Stutzerimonas kunmingensis]|uniref:ATP-dependent nuclease n=1 Tax=Stutzerimonas kunmingensis TaxID=1211807 RepID=UPI0028B23F82|nr:AAA family ATPase [Stutzerimonas kunmingensis]
MASHFTTVKFRNYKAFGSYSLSLTQFNIMVGANNAGKSTVIGAFRILAEGIRRAHSRNADYSESTATKGWGYPINLSDLPVSTENVFTNYDDSEPAIIEFWLSNGNKLRLVFPENDVCVLLCETTGKDVRTPTDFKRAFDASVHFVPVLGPVEHNETLNQKETARRALLTHRASRNFRNIWYHFPDGFEVFRDLIRQTWPGMDIDKPELSRSSDSAKLHMFCPEERMPRELYWAGFGFQVWCQMLTFIAKAPPESLLIIDEPDVYLHSDLQRQLVHLLRSHSGDVLIATHATEIIAEADSGEILVLNKKSKNAQRIKNPSQLQGLFGSLGSNLNPTLTQLAKTKRALFVEGEDFALLSAFARKFNCTSLANRSSFAVVAAKGFNPSRVKDFSDGMEATLGISIKRGIIFDRDYRTSKAVDDLRLALQSSCEFVWIHDRKELENFLLVPSAIERAVAARILDRQARTGKRTHFEVDVASQIGRLADCMKSEVFGQLNSVGVKALIDASPGMDISTATATLHKSFESDWSDFDRRLKVVPGKLLLSRFNEWLQNGYGVSVTPSAIASAMHIGEIPEEMRRLIEALQKFSSS